MKITDDYIEFITTTYKNKLLLFSEIAQYLPLNSGEIEFTTQHLNGMQLKILLEAFKVGSFDESELFKSDQIKEYCLLVGKDLFLRFIGETRAVFHQIQLQIISEKI